MAKKKRHFHCQKCGSACEIYKQGKKHRVLVCPLCGVLATNPISLNAEGALGGAATGAALGSVIPVLGTAAGAALGGAIGGIRYKKAQKVEPSPADVAAPAHTHLTPFEKALMLERLENKHYVS